MNNNHRNRTISVDKKLINSYIRYMRDYVKDEQYKYLTAIKQEDKVKFNLYKNNEVVSKYFKNDYNRAKSEYEKETDGRRKKEKRRTN